MAKNITPFQSSVSAVDRAGLNGHSGMVLWFTGLSGSGKSSIAAETERILFREFGVHTAFLDGDSLRSGLNSDLGFSDSDRSENIRRAGEVAALMAGAGLITLVALISPFAADRDRARALLPRGQFWEIFVDCPFELCQARDPKGLYRQAQAGQIDQFTGLGSAYEAPASPEIHLRSDQHDIEACARQVIGRLKDAGMIK